MNKLIKNRWIVIGLSVLVVLLIGFPVVRQLQPEKVTAHTVQQENVVATITATGEVEARHTVLLAPRIQAPILEILVDEGDVIEEEQVLVKLKDTDIQAELDKSIAQLAQSEAALADIQQGTRPETLQRLEANIKASEAGISQQKASLNTAQIKLKEAKRYAERLKILHTEGAVSTQEYEDAVEAVNRAKKEVIRSQAAVLASEAKTTESQQAFLEAEHGPTQPELAQVAAARDAAQASFNAVSAKLDDYVLKSKLHGLVLERLQDPGDMAQPGQPILKMADPATMEVVAEVEETDLTRVHVNQKALVVFDAFPETSFEGSVTEVGKAVNPENGTLKVRVVLNQPDPNEKKGAAIPALLPGMTADVNIITDQLQKTLVVPTTALSQEDGQYWVYRFKGNQLERQLVKVNRLALDYYQVIDGLLSGDQIAKFASPSLQDKSSVTPKEAPEETAAKK